MFQQALYNVLFSNLATIVDNQTAHSPLLDQQPPAANTDASIKNLTQEAQSAMDQLLVMFKQNQAQLGRQASECDVSPMS